MKDENLQINEVVQPVKVVQEHNEMHAGPIPSAAELQRYKDVDSSLPERIMKQFEADSDHEREQGRKALEAEINFDKRSQFIAVGILLITLGIITFLAYIGANTEATVIAIGEVVILFKSTFSRK